MAERSIYTYLASRKCATAITDTQSPANLKPIVPIPQIYNEDQLWQALASGNTTVTIGAHIQASPGAGAASPACMHARCLAHHRHRRGAHPGKPGEPGRGHTQRFLVRCRQDAAAPPAHLSNTLCPGVPPPVPPTPPCRPCRAAPQMTPGGRWWQGAPPTVVYQMNIVANVGFNFSINE